MSHVRRVSRTGEFDEKMAKSIMSFVENSELSSHQISQLWSCGVPGSHRKNLHAELPSNGYAQRRPSLMSFREHVELRLFPISCVVPLLRPHVYVTRTMVQVRRVCRGPASHPVPFVPFKWVYASTPHSLVTACWWIPAGGKVHPCCPLCIVSHFGVSRYVPCCIEWPRFEQDAGRRGVSPGRLWTVR